MCINLLIFGLLYFLYFRCLLHLIQQVKQLNIDKCNTYLKNYKEKKWTDDHFNQIPIVDTFKQLNVNSAPYVQPQHTPVWPPMLQPTNLKTAQNRPYFSCKMYTWSNYF